MTNDQTILLVDDEDQVLFSSSILLRSAGLGEVVTLSDSSRVMELLAAREVEVIVLDLSMPGITGMELLTMINRDYPDIPVIVMTALSELDTAVVCMKAGSFDYLVKPVEQERFLTSIRTALEMRSLRHEVNSLKDRLLGGKIEQTAAFAGIITASREMAAIFQYVEAIAPSAEPVLITGETGVGKELIAQAVHAAGSRKGPFVAVNVAGFDDTTFADAIFGHVKGAYTGAETRREGMIVKAAQGTLFLDEIGDLREGLQVKLLRLLQEKTYHPLGADTPARCQARIVVATNQDLSARIAAGSFRKDLFYRLRFHHIHVPPLRERPGDIALLAEYFVSETAAALGKKMPPLPAELFPLLTSYPFPGNVRELKAMIADSVARHRQGPLSLDNFRIAIGGAQRTAGRIATGGEEEILLSSPSGRLPTFKEAEDFLVREALRRAQGNQGTAALMLGVTRQALNKRLTRKKAPQDGIYGPT